MNSTTVSILVPIYNVSNYIERCAHSLFQQTFDNIEYIFVNDCTPDDSIEKLQKVIEQYPNRKEQIKIVHHERNRGLAATRNTAVDNSTGKYIQHIDSDDWIELDMIETMYNKAEAEQADIVVCDFFFERKNTKEILCDFVPQHRKDYFYSMVENSATKGYLWNKLVNKKLYELPDCRSIEGLNLLEDRQVTTRLYYYAEKIVKIDKAFYHYNKMNPNAITASKTSMDYENVILFYELLEEFLQEKGLLKNFAGIIECQKATWKVNLLMQTKKITLRKKYAYLYRDIEMKHISKFRRGEKIVLFFTHYGCHLLAHFAYLLIIFKNRERSK